MIRGLRQRLRDVSGEPLRWAMEVNRLAAFLSVGLIALLFLLVVRSGWLLSLVLPVGGLGIALGPAVRHVERGDPTAAVRIHAVWTWIVGVWVTLVVPVIWPTLMLTVLMPLVLAVTHVRRRELIGFIFMSVAVTVVVAVVGLTQVAPGVTEQVERWNPWIRHSLVVASLVAVFVMVVVIILQHHAEAERQAVLLRSSRARLAFVADGERRRIERDLHDGAQQRLVGLAVRLGLLSAKLEGPDAAAVDVMSNELTAAIVELRELAHGIYPPMLTNEGLGPALRAAGRRSPLPTEVTAEPETRYSSEIETALYFCALEAMQNAAKHAGSGTRVRVALRHVDSAIELRVGDDGCGFVASTAPGGGLLNMNDRVGAVGGTVNIESEPGGGVVVIATVPTLS